jgi:colicin import membrane protein
VEALRAQADREARMRVQAERESQLRAQAERESRMRAEADREARDRAAQAAAGAARNRAELAWIDKIRSRIRGYIILPPDIPGNPEAIFDVVQLPTGEIIDVKLRKSSGVRAYDEAVQRAILKASPLPKPAPADLFQRNLELRFRPLDQ